MPKRDRSEPPTVREFRDVLTSARHMLGVGLRSDDPLIEVIREIETALGERSSLPASELLVAIRKHLATAQDGVASAGKSAYRAVSPSTPLETVKEWLAEPAIGRDQLMAIARGRFGIPPGRLSKLSKRGMRDEIEAAIRSLEGFDIIGRVASNDRRHGPVPDLGGVEKSPS